MKRTQYYTQILNVYQTFYNKQKGAQIPLDILYKAIVYFQSKPSVENTNKAIEMIKTYLSMDYKDISEEQISNELSKLNALTIESEIKDSSQKITPFGLFIGGIIASLKNLRGGKRTVRKRKVKRSTKRKTRKNHR
jgi:ADP-dependent phosphofructokinase/glucokinase